MVSKDGTRFYYDIQCSTSDVAVQAMTANEQSILAETIHSLQFVHGEYVELKAIIELRKSNPTMLAILENMA